MQKRIWIRSGIVEELDLRQVRLLELVHEKIQLYYGKLYQTRPCYQYPLSLSQLSKLCRRSMASVVSAVRYLAHTVPLGSVSRPVIYYDRIQAERNKSHRPYRIFLRSDRESAVSDSSTSSAKAH